MADSSTYVNVGLGVVGTGAGVASAVLGYKTYQNSKATSAPAAQPVELRGVRIDPPEPVYQGEGQQPVQRVGTGTSSATAGSYNTARTH